MKRARPSYNKGLGEGEKIELLPFLEIPHPLRIAAYYQQTLNRRLEETRWMRWMVDYSPKTMCLYKCEVQQICHVLLLIREVGHLPVEAYKEIMNAFIYTWTNDNFERASLARCMTPSFK